MIVLCWTPPPPKDMCQVSPTVCQYPLTLLQVETQCPGQSQTIILCMLSWSSLTLVAFFMQILPLHHRQCPLSFSFSQEGVEQNSTSGSHLPGNILCKQNRNKFLLQKQFIKRQPYRTVPLNIVIT